MFLKPLLFTFLTRPNRFGNGVANIYTETQDKKLKFFESKNLLIVSKWEETTLDTNVIYVWFDGEEV